MIFRDAVQCLNGWWDYAPAQSNAAESSVPSTGWAHDRYLVPSLVTKSLAGVRPKGTPFYSEHLNADPAPFCDGQHEFLFDNHQYPVDWMLHPSGWARRSICLDPIPAGRRRFLRFDAVAARCEIWIDGQRVDCHDDAFLPIEIDVTDALSGGSHEIAVLIRDYQRLPDDRKKTLTPSGNMMTAHMRGIWQDVWLIEKSAVFLADSIIRTSVRAGSLTVIATLHNADACAHSVSLDLDVADWHPTTAPAANPAVLTLPSRSVTIAPKQSLTVEITVPWPDAQRWQPESPHLYWLRATLRAPNLPTDFSAERFGFREVWIDGPDFFLNGFVVHFFSDWGHKVNQLHHTEAWNRAWFAMMRRENLNHSRLHTHPHPEHILDLADELGIFITGETAIHGSGGEQAADADAYWRAAHAHIRAFIRRDKNHPCLLLWSIENEMRWNQDQTDNTKHQLPKLYHLFRDLDPTREAYHEGDSSLWNENDQPIISRHYGKECGGYGWWDKQRPLHAGEMSAYHYMGPNTNFHTGEGDALWADYAKVVESAARETLWIVEAGRSQGTAAFGPWNISCLCNLRMHAEPVQLDYPDFTTPGTKPQFIQPHSAEFNFWDPNAPDYTPMGNANAIQAHAFRPFAVIDLSHRRAFFANQSIQRTLFFVNDRNAPVKGRAVVSLSLDGQATFDTAFDATLDRGRSLSKSITIPLPNVLKPTAFAFRVHFVDAEGQTLDSLSQDWLIYPNALPRTSPQRPHSIRVVGNGPSHAWLQQMGLPFDAVPAFDQPIPADVQLLILERNSVIPGSAQNHWVDAFLHQGGKVLLLEQKDSLFPSVTLEPRSVLHGFFRAYQHPILQHFAPNDFEFWGEDPYASMDSDAHIAHRVYQKGPDCSLKPIIDTGEGGFGLKLPEWCALGELTLGSGCLLASQFRLTEKADSIPEAAALFAAMLNYLLDFQPAQHAITAPLHELHSSDPQSLADACNRAANGATVWLRLHDLPDALDTLNPILNTNLSLQTRTLFHAVRTADHSVLAGISHVDVSGIDGMAYCFGAQSTPVAYAVLQHNPALEPILVTPTKAFLEEQHIHGQRVEALRAHGASRFLFAEAPTEAVVLGRIRHGKGTIFIDTFADPDAMAPAHPRLRRFASLLRRNLGAPHPNNPLVGDCVPKAITASNGFPTQICAQPVRDPAHRLTLAANTRLPAERMAPTSLLQLDDWLRLQNPDGNWHPAHAPEIAFFTCFFSPRARKIVMEDSGIPNPESLTFLDVLAPSGDIEIHLNGTAFPPQSLPQNGKTTFSDLQLAQGFNQLLLIWHNPPADAALHFHFRDILRNPESDLTFLIPHPTNPTWLQSEF